MDETQVPFTENIRVKIVEAHNVYFNCHVYPPSNVTNSESDVDDNDSETSQKRAEVKNTFVQTESEETETQNFENKSLNKEKTNTTKHLTSEDLLARKAKSVYGTYYNAGSSEITDLLTSFTDEDKLLTQFQNLHFNASENKTSIRPPSEISEKVISNEVQKSSEDNTCSGSNAATNIYTPSQSNEKDNSMTINVPYNETTCQNVPKQDSTKHSGVANNSQKVSFQEEANLSSFDLFSLIIEKMNPYNDKSSKYSKDSIIKVVLLHSDADADFAKEIVSRLRESDRFWVTADFELQTIVSVNSIDFRKAALDWADIVVPLISNTWLNEIENVSSSSQRSTSSLNARYTFQLIQTNYISSACTNFKIISVVRTGTRSNFRGYPEIRDAMELMRDYRNFEKMIINFHRIAKLYRKSQFDSKQRGT